MQRPALPNELNEAWDGPTIGDYTGILALALVAGGAEAREVCEATVRSAYGEMRATFGSVVLAA